MAPSDKSPGIVNAIKRLGDEEEPRLFDIKEIIITIKCSISSIFQENKALRKHIEKLKSNIDFNDKELKTWKSKQVK